MRNAVCSMLCGLVVIGGCDGGGGGTDPGRVDGGTSMLDAGGGTTDAPSPPRDAPSSDPFAAAREACLNEINRLRATRGLPAYGAWTSAQMCVDQQATADERANDPHGAWGGGTFPECNGRAQNECLGRGPDGIVACLQQMWAEREQPGCAGCDACADAYDPSCPNCDFYGTTTGNVCGHYVNMSARYLTEVACGFSAEGGWSAQNYR